MHPLIATALLVLAGPAPAVWTPIDQPDPVLVVENTYPDLPELTEVVAHRGGLATLHRGDHRWGLLTSRDGSTWATTPVTGAFADLASPVSLASAGDTLLVLELAPELVLWRSADGRRWQRTVLDRPWPDTAGLRLSVHSVEARRVGDFLHVFAGATVHAEWEALFGVPDHLVTATGTTGATLGIRVLAGDREGDYRVQLEEEANAVLLRVVDDEDRVVGEQRLGPIADPAGFIELFIACGGFSPMTESWWLGSDGRPAAAPRWLAELDDYPTVAAGADATFALDPARGFARLGTTGAWEQAELPTSLIQHVFAAGGRVLLVGEEPADGITVWAFDAGEWRRLPTPAVDGVWLAGAVPDRAGALLVYDSGDHQVTATVIGRIDRTRSYRLDIPEPVWGVTVHGDTAVLRTVRGDGDTTLWAWHIERPQPDRPTPR